MSSDQGATAMINYLNVNCKIKFPLNWFSTARVERKVLIVDNGPSEPTGWVDSSILTGRILAQRQLERQVASNWSLCSAQILLDQIIDIKSADRDAQDCDEYFIKYSVIHYEESQIHMKSKN